MEESARAGSRVLVGRNATVRPDGVRPPHFTDAHRKWIGQTGRIHAIVATDVRSNPLVKVGFGDPPQIVFFRLADLEVQHDGAPMNPRKHGERGSHLP